MLHEVKTEDKIGQKRITCLLARPGPTALFEPYGVPSLISIVVAAQLDNEHKSRLMGKMRWMQDRGIIVGLAVKKWADLSNVEKRHMIHDRWTRVARIIHVLCGFKKYYEIKERMAADERRHRSLSRKVSTVELEALRKQLEAFQAKQGVLAEEARLRINVYKCDGIALSKSMLSGTKRHFQLRLKWSAQDANVKENHADPETWRWASRVIKTKDAETSKAPIFDEVFDMGEASVWEYSDIEVTLWDNKSGPRGNKQLGFVRIVVEDLLSGAAHTKEWYPLESLPGHEDCKGARIQMSVQRGSSTGAEPVSSALAPPALAPLAPLESSSTSEDSRLKRGASTPSVSVHAPSKSAAKSAGKAPPAAFRTSSSSLAAKVAVEASPDKLAPSASPKDADTVLNNQHSEHNEAAQRAADAELTTLRTQNASLDEQVASTDGFHGTN